MVSISNSPYINSTQYNYTNDKITDLSPASADTKTVKDAKKNDKAGDTVTLSSEVAAAKTRESMGLAPTGPLKLGDFERAAKTQEEYIQKKLKAAMKDAGIQADQDITLALDSKSRITIKEGFQNKSKLEKALNEDKDFLKTFKSLSANSEVLDYTRELKTRTSHTNLAEFMNSDSDWSDIISLASKYAELKASSNPLETIVGICKSTNPYEFEYKA